jgi:hypothetical protein
VKAVNSMAKPIVGCVRSVKVKVGQAEGRTLFTVMKMDDFKLILGMEFLRDF